MSKASTSVAASPTTAATSSASPGHRAPRLARAVLILAAASFTACMSSRREEELQGSIRTLETKLNEVEKQLLMRDRNIDAVKTSSEDSNRKVLSTKTEMDDLRRQLSLTQGAIDELRVKMTRLQEVAGSSSSASGGGTNLPDEAAGAKVAELEDLTTRMERRLARLELSMGNGPDARPKAADGKGKAGAASRFKSAVDLSRVLGAAYTQKDFKKVLATANEVMGSGAPDDQKEIALGFRAEAYFQMQNYEKSALDFAEFLDKYPRSDRRPRALLLAGDSFVYLKQMRAAKSYYSECVRQHPDRDECKASKERLEKLGV